MNDGAAPKSPRFSVGPPWWFVLAAVLLCAALYLAHVRSARLTPAVASLPATTTGSFTEGSGWYPGEPFAHAAPNLRAWGSWSGSDEHTGTLTLGPFPAPRILRFGLGGYPSNPGNTLHVERTDTARKLPITYPAVGERWRICEFPLPADWEGAPIRLIAVDHSRNIGGWLAISEPLHGGRGHANHALLETLTAWSVNGLLLALLYLAALRLLTATPKLQTPPSRIPQPKTQNPKPGTQNSALPPHWLPLAAAALVASLGYLTFWAYFAHAWLGRALACIWPTAAVAILWRHRRAQLDPPSRRSLRDVALLGFTVSLFYLATLHLFPFSGDLYSLAANRFRPDLPIDNALPFALADRLYRGEPPRIPGADWLSSDRPPLQSAWQLLTLPFADALGLDLAAASGTSAIWLQLTWIPAAYGLLISLGTNAPRATAGVALLALSGFFLQNTTYTWPKLSAAAFAWLSHGGVAFSYLPLIPAFLWQAWRSIRSGSPVSGFRFPVLIFAALVLPWIAYQKFYDPPGNRLLKWHLGGQIDKDPRGTFQTIRENYAQLSWSEIVAAKTANLRQQLGGRWSGFFDLSRDNLVARRSDEFFSFARALGWWLLGLFALPVALLRRSSVPDRTHLVTTLWIVGTIVLWCLLMFMPSSAHVHQGSYAVMLASFALLTAWIAAASRLALILLAVLQSIACFTTWIPASPVIHGALNPVATILASIAAFGLLALVGRGVCPRDKRHDVPTWPQHSPMSPC